MVAPATAAPTAAADAVGEAAAPRRAGGAAILVRALVAFGLLVTLGFAGVWGYYWWQDRPTDQALDASAAAVDSVLEPLAAAETLDEVASAATEVAPALRTIDSSLRELEDERGAYPESARSVLRDQRDLIEAVATLEALSAEDLLVWGAAQPAIAQARDSLADSKDALDRAEAGASERVPDPGPALDSLFDTVGHTAADALTGELSELVDRLGTAENTAMTAQVGASGGPLAEAATSVGAGQVGGLAVRLEALAEAFAAIDALDGMTPTTLGVWSDVKDDLARAADEVNVDASSSIRSMDSWVDRAQVRMARWEEAVAEIRSRRETDLAELDSYSTKVRALMKRYDRARQATSDALEEAELDEFAAYTVEYEMEDGVRERRRILSSLRAQTPPLSMQGAHAALALVIEDAVAAMTTGEQAVEDYNYCYRSCADSFRDTAGWQSFSSESAALTTRFAEAEAAWARTLRSSLAAAGAERLPPTPDV
jgi:hypothetical protein